MKPEKPQLCLLNSNTLHAGVIQHHRTLIQKVWTDVLRRHLPRTSTDSCNQNRDLKFESPLTARAEHCYATLVIFFYSVLAMSSLLISIASYPQYKAICKTKPSHYWQCRQSSDTGYIPCHHRHLCLSHSKWKSSSRWIPCRIISVCFPVLLRQEENSSNGNWGPHGFSSFHISQPFGRGYPVGYLRVPTLISE